MTAHVDVFAVGSVASVDAVESAARVAVAFSGGGDSSETLTLVAQAVNTVAVLRVSPSLTRRVPCQPPLHVPCKDEHSFSWVSWPPRHGAPAATVTS